MKKNIFLLAAMISFAVLTTACSMNVRYEAPRDQLADLCKGNFVNTPSICADSLFVNSGIIAGGYYNCQYWQPEYVQGEGDTLMPGYWYGSFRSNTYANASCKYVNPTYLGAENNNALIIVSEPGYITANDSTLAALRTTYPTALQPHFRTLSGNSFMASLTKALQVNGRMYGRIYLVRSDVESKSILLQTIKRVANAHNKVDMFLAIHGSPSLWLLSPNLNIGLSSNELINFANSSLTLAQRNKVRAIFSTACYGDSSNSYYGPAMTSALSTAFPSSMNYGSKGINWGAMHRDFVAFESFYAGYTFADSVWYGNYYLRYNQANGAYRDRLNYPTLLVRGCADMGLWTDCSNESFSMGSYGMNSTLIENSVGRMVAGVTGNVYSKVANTCIHPDTNAKVLEGTVYSFTTRNTYYEPTDCRLTRFYATCTASGAWSIAIPATRNLSCPYVNPGQVPR